MLYALTNAVVLLLLKVYIIYEAYQRFLAPPEVLSGPMLAVAVVGLIVNLISMRLLAGGSSENLNVKGAYFEVLGDMLGSLGVIAAALLMMWKGWRLADPIIGAGIDLFIVPRTSKWTRCSGACSRFPALLASTTSMCGPSLPVSTPGAATSLSASCRKDRPFCGKRAAWPRRISVSITPFRSRTRPLEQRK